MPHNFDELSISIFYGVVLDKIPKSIDTEFNTDTLPKNVGISFCHDGRLSVGIGQLYINSDKWNEMIMPMELPPSNEIENLKNYLKKHDITQKPNWFLLVECEN